ncbi:minor capsid protein [Actinacidiphila glaucinigra]|uniref:minor capsid protein n=1 Tax=Actinacidiphila glaucinigra TaxID=235986 RepID=UPI003D8E2B25
MSFLTDLVDGLAQLLDAADVGTYYPPGGVYGPDDTAITDTALPSSTDRAVVLTAYFVQESTTLTDCTVMVQVRVRAGTDPREAADLEDAVHAVLHASGPHTFGTARVLLISRVSASALGPDSQGRHERASNYQVRAHQPHPQLS